MQPLTLFDKSFLQSLSLDESVWFDHFFHPIVCPLFYVETLSDLKKQDKKDRTPEKEVQTIAEKLPEVHGNRCAFHLDLCMSNLLGELVSAERGIPLYTERLVKVEGKTGIVFETSPEAEAFSRWANHEFTQLEHKFAKLWRNQLSNVDLIERMKLACLLLRVPSHMYSKILEIWSGQGKPPLARYAPYAAYVTTVEIFFHIALAANLISTDRPSNLLDVAYLHYLPFCDIFVSSDKLHRKCAPLFMRNNQQFIWGLDLKKGLNEIDQHYQQLSIDTKEKGILSFAHTPPKEGHFFISEIWDKQFSNWRNNEIIDNPEKVLPPETVKEIMQIADATPLLKEEVDFDAKDPDTLTIKRKVRKKKGSWYQLPKNIEDK
jgi:hypothetical protein